MPFKDKLKQLAYMRKYQSKRMEYSKEDSELRAITKQVITIAQEHLVGRRLFNLEQLPDVPSIGYKVSRIPIISASITLPVTPQKIEETTLKVVKEEDTLLLTGEHEGWSCLGIEGLATAKHRIIIRSRGNFGRDLIKAAKRLRHYGHQPPYSVIVNTENPVVRNFALPEDGALSDTTVYTSPFLSNWKGEQNNMVVIKPSRTHFTLLMAQDFHVFRSKSACKIWECLAPAINEPKAICEIQGINQ
jgi:hypothetical protein